MYLRSVFFVFTIVMLMGLSACNTMEGAGEDMKSAGESVQNSASEHKHY